MRHVAALFVFPEAPVLVARWFRQLVTVDLALVGIFLALRLAQGLDLLAGMPPAFDVFSDSGLPERFNHLKWAAIAILLFLIFLRLRVPLLLAMAVLFAMILADDALRLHETGSDRLVAAFPNLPTFGMTAAEAGEVAIWLALGLIAVPLLAWGFLSTSQKWWARLGWPMIGFAGLVVFAIGMDVAQQPLWHLENKAVFYWGKTIMGLIEDTGEAVFGSLTLAYAVGLWHVHGRNQQTKGAPAE